ncbi:unnamed protein product [Didymodactylos carnosus]|uniref:GATA zinc finger domain-containing protein 1 n=1 Tax=Didymodactylos carnosus TaxID=1234261 RepID=A0A814GHT3_9BILA|nr:unnamed protein product [Didymodactylos carnosus]CAF1181546.1 unnamed protein product [Didymodactylos carnosus]CAF3768191.1 unnamed protein product [Didymodactylos carnosus]CAF3992827.1 unnamed protein product [Didymodactylos carnosus]
MRIRCHSTIDPRHPRCRLCDTVHSIFWRVPARDLLLCNNCFLRDLNDQTDSNKTSRICKLKRLDTNIPSSDEAGRLENHCILTGYYLPNRTLSTTLKSQKNKINVNHTNSVKSNNNSNGANSSTSTANQRSTISTRNKNRKTIAFKSKKERRFQVGDIVHLMDDSQKSYYGQIRALLQDEHLNSYAFLTWLLPRPNSIHDQYEFNPNSYIIGPNEEYPRDLNSLSFVCHSPTDYFQVKTYPQSYSSPITEKRILNYVWTNFSTVNNKRAATQEDEDDKTNTENIEIDENNSRSKKASKKRSHSAINEQQQQQQSVVKKKRHN